MPFGKSLDEKNIAKFSQSEVEIRGRINKRDVRTKRDLKVAHVTTVITVIQTNSACVNYANLLTSENGQFTGSKHTPGVKQHSQKR